MSSSIQGAFWFPMFTAASVSMVILNKYCATAFPLPYSLLFFQNAMTVVLNVFFVQAGIFKMKPLTLDQFVTFAIPAILFCGMLVTSLMGLPLVSVATTVVFRSCSTGLVAIGDVFLFSKPFSHSEITCLVVVILGALVYAYADLSYDPLGYLWMIVNALIFVVAQLYEKKAISTSEQTPVGIGIVQNLLSLPILFVFGSFVMKEDPREKIAETDNWIRVAIFMTGVAGCMLNLCYTNLSKFASATAIALTGNFNKALSILAGAALFHNPLSYLQAIGLALCIFATYCFSQKGALPSDMRVVALSCLLFFGILQVTDNLQGRSEPARMQSLAAANAEEGFLNKNSRNKNSVKEEVASIPLTKQNLYIGKKDNEAHKMGGKPVKSQEKDEELKHSKEFSDEAGEQIELVVNFRRGLPSIDAQYASPKRIQEVQEAISRALGREKEDVEVLIRPEKAGQRRPSPQSSGEIGTKGAEGASNTHTAAAVSSHTAATGSAHMQHTEKEKGKADRYTEIVTEERDKEKKEKEKEKEKEKGSPRKRAKSDEVSPGVAILERSDPETGSDKWMMRMYMNRDGGE